MTAEPVLGLVPFALRDASRPLLVLGPSLGTSVAALWGDVIPMLESDLDLVGWDLPGHGSAPAPASTMEDLTVQDLSSVVLELVERVQAARGVPGGRFYYAGVSVAGAVGQQLLLYHPDRLAGAALICTATRFGSPEGWIERADLVAAAGTATQITGSAERWFSPGFIGRRPDVATRLLESLHTADRFGYAAVCRALAAFDLTGALGPITAPVIVIAGALDVPAPPARSAEIAAEIPRSRLEILDDAAHLAPAEQPARIAEILIELVGAEGESA
jgi:3-oxoadipate enol-lactonase